MSNETPYENIEELRADAREHDPLADVASGASGMEFEFFHDEDESIGFAFLDTHGPRAVQAFKLLEIAQSSIGAESGTDKLSQAEWALLGNMLGQDFMKEAAAAYADCKDRTRNLDDMHNLDDRTAWRLTEFIHLYENVMRYGERMGRLTRVQAPFVLERLVHDFGEYFGLLVDDQGETQDSAARRIAKYLSKFRRSEHFVEKMPVEFMTRLSMDEEASRELFHFEVSRGIPPHPLQVKERTVRGKNGVLDESDPVEFLTHELEVRYAMGFGEEEAAIINAILPVFAVSHFDGFPSLPEAEQYIVSEQQETRLHEQQCFAVLQCLKHYKGEVPTEMAEYDANQVMKASQQSYREKAKAGMSPSATTLTGMLKSRVSGVFQNIRPVAFRWPKNRSTYTIHGYPATYQFFPQQVTIGTGEDQENYTFLCHAHTDTDPGCERPLMFEYQAVIGEGLLFDAHEACRSFFEDAPDTFKHTLAAGPLVNYAKEAIHPGEAHPTLDLEETKLLGTYVALHGGMQSWLGQRYVLSDEGSDIYDKYPIVRHYLMRLEAE